MKKTILFIIGLFSITTGFAQYTVKGGMGKPFLAENNRANLIQVYLLNGLSNAEITFQTQKKETHYWYKYNTRYADAFFIKKEENVNRSTINGVEDGWAYFVESSSHPTPSFVWIIDYNRYTGRNESLIYRTYSGAIIPLSGNYSLLQDKSTRNDEVINCNGLIVEATMTVTTSTGRIEEQKAGTTETYSAPISVVLEAEANESETTPPVHYIWKIEEENPYTGERTTVLQRNDKRLEYTFEKSGSYVVQLDAVYLGSECNPDISQWFKITIDEPYIRLPNVFSPGSSSGVNNIYRVRSKSLTGFKASIYNRWGNLLYTWNDPDQGWDGKVEGRYVPTGVYFIVVEAKGADGRVYNLSKDINILRVKNR